MLAWWSSRRADSVVGSDGMACVYGTLNASNTQVNPAVTP